MRILESKESYFLDFMPLCCAKCEMTGSEVVQAPIISIDHTHAVLLKVSIQIGSSLGVSKHTHVRTMCIDHCTMYILIWQKIQFSFHFSCIELTILADFHF